MGDFTQQVTSKERPAPGLPYTFEELQLLREMFLAGKPASAIAAKLGRSRQSIYKKVQNLALRDVVETKVKKSQPPPKFNHEQKKASLLVDKISDNALAVQKGTDEYNEVLSTEAANALAVAFSRVRMADSSADLNSALGAAMKADGLYRKANGLEATGSVGTINFYMAGRTDSPLRGKARKVKEEVTDV